MPSPSHPQNVSSASISLQGSPIGGNALNTSGYTVPSSVRSTLEVRLQQELNLFVIALLYTQVIQDVDCGQSNPPSSQ